MRTPEEFDYNLSKGIVTENMLALCLHSVNKRAKNHRDSARQSFSWYHKDANSKKKRKYYKIKTELLKFIKPVCIHCEEKQQKIRISSVDFEDIEDYYLQKELDKEDIVWENSYTISLGRLPGDSIKKKVEFYNIYRNTKSYYLYYEIGDYCFHDPIEREDLRRFKDLSIFFLEEPIVTFGEDPKKLLSVTFVKRVLKALQEGTAKIFLEKL